MSDVNANVGGKTTSGGMGFLLWVGILGVLVLWAVFWGALSIFSHKDYTALGNKTPWGLYIAAYTFLVSSVGACFVGSLGSVFGIEKYVAIAKRAMFLATITVMAGMSLMLVELGQPIHMIGGYLETPNPASPLFGMGVNYSMYLVFVTTEFVLLIRGNLKMAQRVGVVAVAVAVAADSTVGSVLGLPHAKAFWNGPYLPIDFILCAWIMGFAMLIVAAYVASSRPANRDRMLTLIDGMGTWLAMLLAIDMLFVLWKVFTGMYGGAEGEKYLATAALVKGPLSVEFWVGEIALGLVTPLALLILPGLKTARNSCIAGILALVGLFINKVDMVQAPQMVPLQIFGQSAYRLHTPSMVEFSIVAGAIACVLLVYSVIERYQLLPLEA